MRKITFSILSLLLLAACRRDINNVDPKSPLTAPASSLFTNAQATLANTIKDLDIHAQVFDIMGLPATHLHKINIHVGGAYGDKGETIQRFIQNFSLLSASAQKRLSVENDDKPGLYTVQDLVPVHESIGVPVVFDYFHHRLHPGTQTEEEAFLTAFNTWDVKPVFHYSSSRREYEDPTSKKESHSDWVHEPINTYGKKVDIILETKMKELSLIKYRRQFGNGEV